MKSILNLFVAVMALGMLASCGDDTGDLNMNIKLQYDGEPMVMLQNYTYPSGETFYLTKVSMYMSDIAVGEQAVSAVEFVNLADSHADAAGAADGFSMTFADVPAGEYANFNFGLGVNAANNAMAPGDFASDNPLSNAGEYWPAWESYVFYKIEGQLDTDGDGTPDQGLSLHCGGNEVYSVLTAPKTITIDGSEDATIELTINMERVFDNNGVIYDLAGNPGLHSKANHLPQMQTLVTNTAAAITVR